MDAKKTADNDGGANEEALRCLKAIRNLNKLIQDQVEGKDPNISILLGIKDEDEQQEFQSQSAILKVIHTEISNVQNLIASYYADQLGNQCAVQWCKIRYCTMSDFKKVGLIQ